MIIGKDAPLGPSCVRASNVTSTSAVISWLPSNSNFQHTGIVKKKMIFFSESNQRADTWYFHQTLKEFSTSDTYQLVVVLSIYYYLSHGHQFLQTWKCFSSSTSFSHFLIFYMFSRGTSSSSPASSFVNMMTIFTCRLCNQYTQEKKESLNFHDFQELT